MSNPRIGDHDREHVVRLLQEHVAAGRLTLAEFDDRSGRAYAARTREDLEPLLADLPVTLQEPLPPPDAPNPRHPARTALGPGAVCLLGIALLIAGTPGAPALLAAAAIWAGMTACRPGHTALCGSGLTLAVRRARAGTRLEGPSAP